LQKLSGLLFWAHPVEQNVLCTYDKTNSYLTFWGHHPVYLTVPLNMPRCSWSVLYFFGYMAL